MTIQVNIKRGFYRSKPVTGTFQLIKSWQTGARGGFITIRNANPEPGTPPIQRVNCEQGDFVLLDSTGIELSEHMSVDTTSDGIVAVNNYEKEFIQNESAESAMERISETFAMLDRIVDSCARGIVRGLVVSGPPGIGKSFGVEKKLEEANLFRRLEGKKPMYEIISGGVSPVNLYKKLYHNRSKESVIVFDDCDAVLFDEEMLNMLKNALNSSDKRRISYFKESRVLADEGIENTFDFEGSVIFLSNINFEKTIEKESRLSNHLAAIMSRCHYLDLDIGTMRDKLLRIRQVVRDGMLASYDFDKTQETVILDFVVEHAEYLREVSLRMVKKIADFVKSEPTNWLPMVEATCLTRDAKFKRLIERDRRRREYGIEMAGV